jgi:hypothetical protein
MEQDDGHRHSGALEFAVPPVSAPPARSSGRKVMKVLLICMLGIIGLVLAMRWRCHRKETIGRALRGQKNAHPNCFGRANRLVRRGVRGYRTLFTIRGPFY